MMLDNDFVVLAVNRAFCDITQKQNSMVVGKPYIFHHATIASNTFHELIKTQVHNRTQWLGEAVDKRTDGNDYPLELAIYGEFDDRISLTHYVVNFSDITERKRTEENLRLGANVSASMGISLFPDHGTDLEALLRKADRAMYEAKTLGRNQLHFHKSDPPGCEIVAAKDSADS